MGNGDRVRFQEVHWIPVSVGQAAEGLDITAGNVTVFIPDDVPVVVRADMTLGNLNDGNGRGGGTTTRETRYNSGEPGNQLVIEIDGTLSNVSIQEGN